MPYPINYKAWLKPICVFSVAALLMAAPFPLVYRWIFEGNALALQSFFVVETEHIKPAEVREYLKGYLGQPFYGVDLAEMARSLERHPWVSSVSLRRAPPHAIVVEAIERKPIAVASMNRLLLVDEDAKPFHVASASEAAKWPLIKPKSKKQPRLDLAAAALKSYNASSQSAGKIAEIHFDENDSLVLVFANGIRAELGNDKFNEKWQKLDSVLNSIQGNEIKLTHIYLGDYPNPHQVAVQFERNNDSRGYANGSTETR